MPFTVESIRPQQDVFFFSFSVDRLVQSKETSLDCVTTRESSEILN